MGDVCWMFKQACVDENNIVLIFDVSKPELHFPAIACGSLRANVPTKKISHWANICCSARAIAQPCRHTNSEAFQVLQGLCNIFTIWNLECCKCAKMRFHCAKSLMVPPCREHCFLEPFSLIESIILCSKSCFSASLSSSFEVHQYVTHCLVFTFTEKANSTGIATAVRHYNFWPPNTDP